MALPTEKSKPSENLEDKNILILGPPKIGKSSLIACFPSVLFLATEDGLGEIECFNSRIISWEEYLLKLTELKTQKHDFKNVAIDTTDNWYFLGRDFVMKKYNIEHPSDIEHGKGWDLLKDTLRSGMVEASKLGLGLIFISHSREIEIRKKGKELYTKVTYAIPEHARVMITGMVDIILYMTIENGRRIIKTKPSEEYEAGDRTGRLPNTLPVFPDMKQTYENFVTCYYSASGIEEAKEKLKLRIKKAEAILAEEKIDGFDVEKRQMNSRKKHLGTEDLEKMNLTELQEYIKYLGLKYKQSRKEQANGKNSTTS